METKTEKTNKRLDALDVMRGLTIAGMIVVNNGGAESYAPLRHCAWNGMTPCDLVFPFFLFIMGVTTFLSLSKTGFRFSLLTARKIFRRTILILLVCWILHWFDNVCSGHGFFDFGQLRLTGVLTRIALCYCIVSFLAITLSRNVMIWIAVILLILYGGLLLMFDGYANDLTNVNALVDRWILPEGHLYTKQPVDPEGILATLSAVAHTVIGFSCGSLIRSDRPLADRLLTLMVVAVIMMVAGYILSGLLPLNKRVWSPSYVLVSCGMAAALLATLSYFIDIRGYSGWFLIFKAFGVNPLFLYVFSEALSVILSTSGLYGNLYSLIHYFVADPRLASACYAVGLMLFLGLLFALPLYRRRVYIKI